MNCEENCRASNLSGVLWQLIGVTLPLKKYFPPVLRSASLQVLGGLAFVVGLNTDFKSACRLGGIFFVESFLSDV